MAGASSDDYQVVPDAQGGAKPGFPSLPQGGLHPLPDPNGAYSHLSTKLFSYDQGQAGQQFLPRNPQAASVVPVIGQQQQQQQPGTSAPAQQQQQNGQRLTASQQSELDMARRRAEKAAEGKRANATAARRAKRRATRNEPEHDGTASSEEMHSTHQHKDDIEARLATVEDEKEAKRLKRLLRNRVSAQQARERKKSYVSTLESKSAGQDEKITQLQQRVKTVERENVMLRQIIKGMQQKSPAEAPEPVPPLAP